MLPWICHCQLVAGSGTQQPGHGTGPGNERATALGVATAEAIGAAARVSVQTRIEIGRCTMEVSAGGRSKLDLGQADRQPLLERSAPCTVGSNRAVLFDLHDTLVHLVPSTEEAMAAAIGARVDDYRLAWRTIDERIEKGTWAPATAERWRDLYAPMVAALDLPIGPEEVAARFGTLFRTADAYAAFPDVAPALRALADAGFRLGVLSNSDFPLEPILARAGSTASSTRLFVP